MGVKSHDADYPQAGQGKKMYLWKGSQKEGEKGNGKSKLSAQKKEYYSDNFLEFEIISK